jgi:hypothetical protein
MSVYPSSYGQKLRTANWAPIDQGFKIWSFDFPSYTLANSATVDGRIYLAGIYVPCPMSITTAHAYCGAAGTSVTSGRFGLFSYDGVKRAETASQTTGFQSTGLKSLALSATTVLSRGYYWGAIFTNASTDPQWKRAPNITGAEVNVNLSSATSRCAWLSTTGHTSFPGTIDGAAAFTPGTGFAASPANLFWMAFS